MGMSSSSDLAIEKAAGIDINEIEIRPKKVEVPIQYRTILNTKNSRNRLKQNIRKLQSSQFIGACIYKMFARVIEQKYELTTSLTNNNNNGLFY